MAKAPSRGKRPTSKGGKKPAAKKPMKAKSRPAPRASSGGGGGGYEIICSECYTSFSFRPSGGGSSITCPVCMHVGQFAESDVMTNVVIAKKSEKAGFLKALIPTLLLLGCGLAYTIVLTQKGAAGESLESTGHYAFIGVGALLLIVTLATAVKYESNRYDVYF